MAHIRSVTAARKVLADCQRGPEPSLALQLGGIAKTDLVYDLYGAWSTYIWRKKFEPLPGGGS
jgi:hypothetical protein